MVKHQIANIIRALKRKLNNRVLVNKNISIISNNCWGGGMCQYSGIQYNSPFVGLFLFADDYIRLLQNIDIIYEPFTFIERTKSKYYDRLDKKEYPIGYWSKYDIEIHFLHYKNQNECIEKWNRRLTRLDMNNLIVKFSENNLCTEYQIHKFDTLPYNNKVCFTCSNYPQYKSTVYLKEQNKYESVHYCWEISDKYWNFVEHANKIDRPNNCSSFIEKLLLWIAAHIKISMG